MKKFNILVFGVTYMKVALITMRPKVADKKANLEIMKKHIEKTKADMYIFR
jgi:predicted amidohydrolase